MFWRSLNQQKNQQNISIQYLDFNILLDLLFRYYHCSYCTGYYCTGDIIAQIAQSNGCLSGTFMEGNLFWTPGMIQ